MLHTSETEPHGDLSQRKLSTWGIRATLMIQNGILTAARAELALGTQARTGARKRTPEPARVRAIPEPRLRKAPGSRNRHASASRSRPVAAWWWRTLRPAGRPL